MSLLTKCLVASAALVSVAYLAVIALLYFNQNKFIYYPTGRSSEVPSFVMHRDDANIVVSTDSIQGTQAILYFGGNAEDVSQSVRQLSSAFPGKAIYAMHYRSYGGSTGSPSERALISDGLTLYDAIATRHPNITLVGRSLGSGIAIQIAAKKPAEKLILVTPYNSILELAQSQFKLFPVQWILRDTFESWRYAPKIRVPTTLYVASHDQVIPNQSSYALARAFPPGIARVVTLQNTDHNSISASPDYLK